jgi:hypothetical protein
MWVALVQSHGCHMPGVQYTTSCNQHCSTRHAVMLGDKMHIDFSQDSGLLPHTSALEHSHRTVLGRSQPRRCRASRQLASHCSQRSASHATAKHAGRLDPVCSISSGWGAATHRSGECTLPRFHSTARGRQPCNDPAAEALQLPPLFADTMQVCNCPTLSHIVLRSPAMVILVGVYLVRAQGVGIGRIYCKCDPRQY